MSDDTEIPIYFTNVADGIQLNDKSTADYVSGLAVDHVRTFAKELAQKEGKDVYVYGFSPDPSGQGQFLFAVSPTGEFTPA